MKAWVHLYVSHRKGRASVRWEACAEDIRKLLIQVADAGHCDGSIRGRFTGRHDGNVVVWSIRRNGERAAEPLMGLPDLEVAKIYVACIADGRGRLHAFTVSVEGMRKDGSSWSLAVDLPDDRGGVDSADGDRQGRGACGHAALHCHVGPDRETSPQVRVPLPSLTPSEVLQWVFSQIIPTLAFEPAPWAAVKADLEKRTR